jgi:hypothetical protein
MEITGQSIMRRCAVQIAKWRVLCVHQSRSWWGRAVSPVQFFVMLSTACWAAVEWARCTARFGKTISSGNRLAIKVIPSMLAGPDVAARFRSGQRCRGAR